MAGSAFMKMEPEIPQHLPLTLINMCSMTDYAIGTSYFRIWYADDARLYLVPDSLIFVGRNIEERNRDTWFFQDASSYLQLGAYPNHSDCDDPELSARVYFLHEEDLYQIVDLQGLQLEAEECADRWRRITQV
jgi:hypothetical protein